MVADTRYDNSRRYYLRVAESDFEGRALPDILINRYKKNAWIECQTLDLVKLNQRMEGSHQEVVLMSDQTVQDLIDNIRGEIPALFRVCESIAMLDMITAFAHLTTTVDPQAEYARPQITDRIAVGSGRHPIKERVSAILLHEQMQKLTSPSRSRKKSLFPTIYMPVSKIDSRSSLAAT